MNKSLTSIVSILLLTSMCACTGNTEKENDSDSTYVEVDPATIIQSLEDYTLNGDIDVNGTKYTYYLTFETDKSLPVITNHEGYRYYDNKVELAIYKAKSNELVYDHTFTKESFKNLVPSGNFEHLSLVGFNFNYLMDDKHDRFYFIGVVGDPDDTSDIMYSIGIAITASGEISTSIIQDIDVDPEHNDMNVDPDEFDA